MIISILVTAIVSFFFSEAVGFAIHRLAHWSGSGKLFQDHLNHHAVAYPPSKYLSAKYLGDLRTSFIPYFIPVFVAFNLLAFAIMSWPMALTFLVVSSAVSLASNMLHDSYHVKDHWLTRFSWHRHLREVHRVHHVNVKKNLGIYFYFYDRLFGSFRPSSK